MDIFHWKRRHNSFFKFWISNKKAPKRPHIFFQKSIYTSSLKPADLGTVQQNFDDIFLILDFKNRYLKSFQVYEDWITSNLNYFRLVEHTSKQTTYHLSSHNAIAALVIFKLREI